MGDIRGVDLVGEVHELITRYYAALNRHHVPSIVAMLSDDIEVTFPDPARNWRGVDNAREKFGGWFASAPSVHCDFTILQSSIHTGQIGEEVHVVLKARFTSDGKTTERELLYHCTPTLISFIEHRG